MNGDVVDRRTGVLEQPQRFGIVADLDADIGQDSVGMGLDQGKAFFAKQFVGRDVAADERRGLRLGGFAGAGGHSCRAPTAAAMTSIVHQEPLSRHECTRNGTRRTEPGTVRKECQLGGAQT